MNPNVAPNLTDRLKEFLNEWCNMDSSAEEVADMLHGPDGAYYHDWLPKELGEALRSESITPQYMSERLLMHFDNQEKLNDYFRRRWVMWFPDLPFPLDGTADK